MMKDKQIDLKFQIKAVEVLDFSLAKQSEPLPQKITFNFNISIEHRLNPEQKLIFVIVTISILKEDKKSQLGSIRVNCIFSIENFDDIAKQKESNIYHISENVNDLLNSISLSTSRGVMATTFKGTILHTAILPIVNPQDFKKDNKQKK